MQLTISHLKPKKIDCSGTGGCPRGSGNLTPAKFVRNFSFRTLGRKYELART